jgi:hypothetical protein
MYVRVRTCFLPALQATNRATTDSPSEDGFSRGADMPAAARGRALSLRGVVVCKHPNKYLDDFSGEYLVHGAQAASVAAAAEGGTRVPLTVEHLILRGCRLRACTWVVGAVVYVRRSLACAFVACFFVFSFFSGFQILLRAHTKSAGLTQECCCRCCRVATD